jgi:DNA-binding LacI/PurR family transcriptional regulator
MAKRQITRKDVAERAGVSVAVVSYVVNDGPRPVSSETKDKVEKAIQELGYYPNELARSLSRRKSATIGLIAPSLINPVYAEIAASLEDDISVVGYDDTASSAYQNPPLTTVKFPVAEMGRRAGQIILELIRENGGLPPHTLTLPVELVVRGSTAPPPKES